MTYLTFCVTTTRLIALTLGGIRTRICHAQAIFGTPTPVARGRRPIVGRDRALPRPRGADRSGWRGPGRTTRRLGRITPLSRPRNPQQIPSRQHPRDRTRGPRRTLRVVRAHSDEAPLGQLSPVKNDHAHRPDPRDRVGRARGLGNPVQLGWLGHARLPHLGSVKDQPK
jgi:hypothetical protein